MKMFLFAKQKKITEKKVQLKINKNDESEKINTVICI